MSAFLNLILALLGVKRNASIEAIVKPMAVIVKRLETFAEEQEKCSCKNAERADELLKKAKSEGAAATDARQLASRYSTLTL
jgi:hypothetical protein